MQNGLLSKNTFIYDTENSDLNVKHGQITQFGGIRVDEHFSIIDELDIPVRLLGWVVPTPKACSVTKVPPEQLVKSDRVSEFTAATRISAFLTPDSYAPRTYITYNGSRHDDECLRYMFYKNLLNPWFNSGKSVTKIDLFPLVQLIHAVDPSIIKVPTDDAGKLSFKLDRICPENNIEIRAHDALGDCIACADLAKLIVKHAPWAWRIAERNGQFQTVEASIASSINEVKPLWLFTHFGEPKYSPVVPICSDGMNTHVVLDLTAEQYPTQFGDDAKLVGKGSPFNLIKTKSIPLLLTTEEVAEFGVKFDQQELEARFAKIREDKELFKNALAAMKRPFEIPADQTSEEKMIGNGFPDKETEGNMRKFVSATNWEERLSLRFPNDRRMREFAARIILDANVNGEVSIKDTFRDELMAICENTIMRPYDGETARWTTLSHALKDEPDRAWLEWAIGRYGDDPRLVRAIEALDNPAPVLTSLEPASDQLQEEGSNCVLDLYSY